MLYSVCEYVTLKCIYYVGKHTTDRNTDLIYIAYCICIHNIARKHIHTTGGIKAYTYIILLYYNIPCTTVHCSIGHRSPRPLRSDLSYRGTACCCKVGVPEEVPELISGDTVVRVVVVVAVVGVVVGVGVVGVAERECKVCSSRGISCVPAV